MSDPAAGFPPPDWSPGHPGSPELATLDAQITGLIARSTQARQAWEVAESQLATARQHRHQLVEQLTALSRPPVPRPAKEAAAPPATGPETSTRTVQNVLFILGGILLGTAAIVFTAVAWASYGVGGRAAILAVVTLLALSAPLVALRRRLTATAETFAAVGLLLVVLDGYAAWYVDLFGVANLSGPQYAGVVALATAAVAAGYGAATRLTGPGFVALLAIQPVAPLLAGPLHPSEAGWSMIVTGVAGLNLLVVLGRRRAQAAAAMRATAWVLYGVALAFAVVAAIWSELSVWTATDAAAAGLAIVATAAMLAAGAWVTREDSFLAMAACLSMLAVTVAVSIYAAVAWPGYALVSVAAVVGVVAVLGRTVGRALAGHTPTPQDPDSAGTGTDGATPVGAPPVGAAPRHPGLRSGSAAGAVVGVGALALALLGYTVIAAAHTLVRAVPVWSSTLASTTLFDWQLLAAIGLAAAAGSLVVGRRAQWTVGALAAVALVFAWPDAIPLAWWAPSVVDLVAAGLLLVGAIRPRPMRATAAPAVAAAILSTHAVLASLGRPGSTAAILGGVVLLGLTGGALGRSPGASRPVAGWSLGLGLLALPPAVAAGQVAADRAGVLDLTAAGQARVTIAAVALLLVGLVAIRRWWPALAWYGFAAFLVSAAIWPLVIVASGHGPSGVYGGLGLVLVALSLLPMTSATTAADADPAAVSTKPVAVSAAIAGGFTSALLLAVDAVPAMLAVLGGPYSWLGSIWTGVSDGVGLTPPNALALPPVTAVAAWSLALLAVASATAAYAVTRSVPAAIGGLGIGGPTAIIVGCVAAGLSWPAVPAVTLGLGLLFLVLAGTVRISPVRSVVATSQGLLYLGAGLAGALTVRWSTIVGLASIVVVAAVVGAVGRTVAWRSWGWVCAVVAGVGLAVAAGLAADLTVRNTAFGVLGVAIAALALSAALRARQAAESVAVASAGHAAAVVAVLLTDGWAGHTGLVSAIWGLALGLRALWPGTSRSGRAALAATGAAWELLAWWLLLVDRGVTLVEAYTIPLAGVGLLAGWAALRRRPELRSWVSYGPALAAALLPSLAIVLASDGGPWRRALLGIAALLITIAGAIRRRQAPVVAGGAVLVILALHELVLIRDHLPRWSLLAVGGLILVGLAITYERRRRDMARLREALGRMS